MRKVIRVDVDGSLTELDLDSPIASSLTILQGAVDGWIDCVAVSDILDLYINDEGKIVGMEPNPIATRFAETVLQRGDYIAGPAVFTGGVDEEGNTLALRESTELVLKFFSKTLRGE